MWASSPVGLMFLIRYYTLKAVKRCTQIWAYLWATHKNSYSKWRCPQSWGYLWAWTIFTCKNLCSSHFFRNWLFSKVNAILRSVDTVAHFWASLLGVVILTMLILVTVRKFRSSLTNAIFRWSTTENSGFGTTTRACRWTQFCAVIVLSLIKLNIQRCLGCWRMLKLKRFELHKTSIQ